MTTTDSEPEAAPAKLDTGFFGQPRPLATLFGVEMWERFSSYGMQGILLIYLYYSVAKDGLGLDKASAAAIVGAYGGGVYLATVLGAWIADRLLGSERARATEIPHADGRAVLPVGRARQRGIRGARRVLQPD